MRLLLPIVILVALVVGSMMLSTPTHQAELTTGYVSIETLDPQVARASEDIRVTYALFEGLMTFDNDFNVVPGVAASYDVSDDRRTYTFHLRRDAKWSDGHPVTADDFYRAWMLGMLPDTAPPYIDFLHYIDGGKAFTEHAGELLAEVSDLPPTQRLPAARQRIETLHRDFAEMVGVRAPDDHTLIVELAQPTLYFNEIAATWPLFPLPMHVIDELSSVDPGTLMYRRDSQWVKPGHDPTTMVSNGPYRLTGWRFKNHIRFEANPHYWNRQIVGPRTVELKNFTAHQAMYNAYHSGTLDIYLGATPLPFAPELIEALRDGRRDDVHPFNAFGTYYYEFNCRPTWRGEPNRFADARVRRAFTLAIDKAVITRQVTRLHQQPAGGFVPPNSIKGYTSPDGLGYDVEAARKLLRDAGYGPSKPFGAVTFSYNTGGGHENVAQAVARMWEMAFDAFNVSVKLDPMEWKVFLSKRQSGDFEIARAGWFGDYMDPTTFLDMFVTGNGHNDGGFSNETYDHLLEKAATTLDPDARFELLARAERLLVQEQLPIIPLYYYRIIDLYDEDHVAGVSKHPRNLPLFYRMRVHPNQ